MKRQRSGFSIPKFDSAHIAAQHAKRDAANDEFMARMFGSTDSQSAGGAETKAPTTAAPAAEPGTQHRGVTPEGTARVEDEPHEVMASQGSSSPSPRPRVPGSIETETELRLQLKNRCACVIGTDAYLALEVTDACRRICIRTTAPSLYAESDCVKCGGTGKHPPPSWMRRLSEPATASTDAEVGDPHLKRRRKTDLGTPPEGSRPIPGFPGFSITEAGSVFRGANPVAQRLTSTGQPAAQMRAADGTKTQRTIARLLRDVWNVGDEPSSQPPPPKRDVPRGICAWVDGCEKKVAPPRDGTARATPVELRPFCAEHKHVLRVSGPQRARHGIPSALSYSSRVSIGSRARAIAQGGPMGVDEARLLLELIDSAGGIDRVRELAGGAA